MTQPSAPAPSTGSATVDLVIQSTALSTEAFEAFRVALLGPRHRRHADAARFYDIPADAQNRRIAQALAAFWRCDATLVQSGLRTSDMRLLVMDMDSTAIAVEGIDELAALAGQGPAVAAITEAAMRGEIADYADSLRRRVGLLAGTEFALAERLRDGGLPPTPGARELLAEARRLGWSTLLVSGGFSVFAEAVARELGFDASCANELLVRDGRLTGEVVGPPANDGAILDAAGKAHMLQRTCARLGCTPARAIAVGDGANDLEMMALSGLSVAYRAKPVVRRRAGCALDHARLDGLLELFADRW
jgi:phosphoserine phosphatase